MAMKHLTPIGVQRLAVLNHCSTSESRKLCHSCTVVSVLWAIKDTTFTFSLLKKEKTLSIRAEEHGLFADLQNCSNRDWECQQQPRVCLSCHRAARGFSTSSMFFEGSLVWSYRSPPFAFILK